MGLKNFMERNKMCKGKTMILIDKERKKDIKEDQI